MPLGPVFRWETAAIARRKRTYVIRGIYGLVILTCFSLPLLDTIGLSSARELEHRQLAAASQESFGAMMFGQALALLLVTPALFAGAIAQEVERGNLILLLASPASSLEIVLGKLGPRIAQVVLILAVAVPVLGLLSLNGGVNDQLVILSDAVLLTSAFLIASVAMLISVISASLRQAVLWTYVAEILWLAAPAFFDRVAAYATPTVSEWSGLIAVLLAMTSPFSVLTELNTLPPTIVGDFLRTMLVQLGLGAVLVAVAALLLRPVASGAGPFGWRLAPVTFLLSRRRLLPRGACGERPVLWKEMHVARSRVLARLSHARCSGRPVPARLGDVEDGRAGFPGGRGRGIRLGETHGGAARNSICSCVLLLSASTCYWQSDWPSSAPPASRARKRRLPGPA